MGQIDENEDSLFTKHQELCRRLNLDANAAKDSWDAYERIKENYTLEGDQLQWLGCALYVTCRQASSPAVGRTGGSQGNCVVITKLLHLYNLTLIEFFTKSKAWADMNNMPKDFVARIDLLHKNFSVSSVIFQKYEPIFKNIFKFSANDLNNQPRSKKLKAVPCTPSKLFEFTWLLFICLKSKITSISDDLVNSYHMLLVVCDLVYSNALLASRKDLLNPDFSGLPKNFNDNDFFSPSKANCIVSLLCKNYDAVTLDAIGIKEYIFKELVTKLFNDKVLKGNSSNFTAITEGPNFEANFKALNKIYDRHILSVGNIDERIFLDPESNNCIHSSPSKGANQSDQDLIQSKKEQVKTINLSEATPFSAHKYLKAKDVTIVTQTFHPTQSVIRLSTLLIGCQTTPSENLRKIFENSSPELQTFIQTKIEELGKTFYNEYIQSSKTTEENKSPGFDFGQKRLQSAKTLFYKILELVLTQEIKKKPEADLSVLLKNVDFIQCLFACSCEIVIYSYQNRDKMFPWVLKALNLKAYNFFKVIEITIRVCVDQLTRDMVKYLSRIEESVLESLAWESKSPLWQEIESCEGGVPSYEDVALPGTFGGVNHNLPSQLAHRRNNDREAKSPLPSATERFDLSFEASPITQKCAQSVLKPSNQTLVLRTSTVDLTNGLVPNTPEPTKPRRTGSLALFFRKFYNMSEMRMQALCAELQITEDDLKRKIWTIFECSMIRRTHLMKDRHLDQILVCAVYVVCKLCKIGKNTFAEIMQCYRKQPQAASHIYRSVLISKISNDSGSTEEKSKRKNQANNNIPPTPSNMAATSQVYVTEDGTVERGDLIKFYNTIYVPEVKPIAEKYGLLKGCMTNLLLSPLPTPRTASKAPSVRRVTESVLTRVLDPKEIVESPADTQIHYCFNRSPTKNLETINKMMIEVSTKKKAGKRLLTEETETIGEAEAKKARTATFVSKIENVLDERRSQNN